MENLAVRKSPDDARVKIKYGKLLYNQRYLIGMSFPFLVWLIVFAYTPLIGWIMAFENFKPSHGYFNQKFVGLLHFKEFLTDRAFYQVLQNTFIISMLNLTFGIFFAILLAILLNEIKNKYFKRIIQTVSYLPHFVSWVVVVSIFYTILSPDGGVINKMLLSIGVIKEAQAWLAHPRMFYGFVTVAQVWKEMGWNSIIYLAAIAGIDQGLYEAADVDGVGRFGKIWHITLPGIKPTIMLLLVLGIGGFFNGAGFDPCFLLGNTMTRTYSDSLAVYAYRYGLEMSRYSMSTAISIFNSAVSIILLFSANKLSEKFTGQKVI
jgi:putative aldouronate transport system permease protein